MPLRQSITRNYLQHLVGGCGHCEKDINRALIIFQFSEVPLNALELSKYAFSIVQQDHLFLLGMPCGGYFEIEIQNTEVDVKSLLC